MLQFTHMFIIELCPELFILPGKLILRSENMLVPSLLALEKFKKKKKSMNMKKFACRDKLQKQSTISVTNRLKVVS